MRLASGSGADRRLLLLCLVLSLALFILDLIIPLGVAAGVPHVLVILLALRSSRAIYPIGFGYLCSIFTVAGYFYSEPGGVSWMILTNRGLALLVIWLTVILGLQLKRAHIALRESEDRFRLVADQAPVMIWHADRDKAWDFFSKGLLDFLGKQFEQVVGMAWLESVHHADRMALMRAYNLAHQQHTPLDVECRMRNAAGEYRWTVLHGAPRHLHDGEFVGFVGTILDIEERKQSEKRVEEARQKKFHREKMASIGTLSSGLLHEIINPVASISGLVQGLQQEYSALDASDDPLVIQTREYLAMISDSLAQLTAAAEDFRYFATMHGDTLEPQDLNALIDQICRLLRHDERMRTIDLRLSLDPNLPAVWFVADHFIHLLHNLLNNAVIACADRSQGALIEITTRAEDGRVVILITDNGCGIPDGILRKILDPQTPVMTSGKVMGMGLAVSQALLAEYAGDMEIKTAEGIGTQVRIYIPLSENRPAVEGDTTSDLLPAG